ncbi:MAG: class I SAM-dependent methyltransferase [Treponema sp.]|jgi:SAM-dependent methyltransferase|nr:class I SAM-dependent methyltransferase [Treponema sp.]
MAVKTWSTPATTGEERRPVPCTLCGGNAFVPHFSCEDFPAEKTASKNGETRPVTFSYVRCKQCGLVQINPQPDPAAVASRYGRGEDYLAYELENEAAFLRLQELALGDAGFFTLEKKNGRILDIGCATGALLASLEKRGWIVQGVEISGPQAEYCRGRGLEVSGLPLEENHFPPEHFDAVSASHLIEHLNDPGVFVREIYRILKKGGRLYVTTPNIAGFQARLFGGRWRSAIFDHLYLFSGGTLRALLERAGFRIERCSTWGGLAAGLAPKPVKALFDKAAKSFGFGDVMIVRAAKARQ